MLRFWYPLALAVFSATLAEGAWVKPTKGLACTEDYNEWGHGSYCPCPESTVYNKKIGECLAGVPYPIMVSGVMRSKQATTQGVFLDTEFGRFRLIVKLNELAKLQKVDGLYFEAEGEFLLYQQKSTIVVDRLSRLE